MICSENDVWLSYYERSQKCVKKTTFCQTFLMTFSWLISDFAIYWDVRINPSHWHVHLVNGNKFQCSDSCHSVVGRSSVYLEKVAISLPPPKNSSMILYPHKHFGWRYTEFSTSIGSHHDEQESPSGSIPNEGWFRDGFIPQIDRKFINIHLVKFLLRTGYVSYVATFGSLLDPGLHSRWFLAAFQRNSNLLPHRPSTLESVSFIFHFEFWLNKI